MAPELKVLVYFCDLYSVIEQRTIIDNGDTHAVAFRLKLGLKMS